MRGRSQHRGGNAGNLRRRDDCAVEIGGLPTVIGQSKRPCQLGQSRGGRVVVDSGLGVDDIQGLSQVALRQQVAAEAAHVRQLQREALREFAADGKVDGIGVWSLEGVVDAPQVGLRGGAGRLRKASRWRRLEELRDGNPGRRIVDCGNGVDAGDPRQVLCSRLIERAARILQRCGQTGRTDLVKAIQERESRTVVNPAETRANDGLVVLAEHFLEQSTTKTRRIGDGNSRRPIGLFKGVEARAVVYWSAERE